MNLNSSSKIVFFTFFVGLACLTWLFESTSLVDAVTPSTSSPVIKHASIGANCSYYAQPEDRCGRNAVCGYGQRCICKFGHLPIEPGRVDCQAIKCDTTRDCVRHFGPNTKCGHAQGKYCDCDWPPPPAVEAEVKEGRINSSTTSEIKKNKIYFDRQTQSCVRGRSELKPLDCSSNTNCGSGMFCSGGRSCRCRFGYQLNKDGYNCDRIQCTRWTDCRPDTPYPVLMSTECRSTLQCACARASGYRLDERTQECEFRGIESITVRPPPNRKPVVSSGNDDGSSKLILILAVVVAFVLTAFCIMGSVVCRGSNSNSGAVRSVHYYNNNDDNTTNVYVSSSSSPTVFSSGDDYHTTTSSSNDYHTTSSCNDHSSSSHHYNHEAIDCNGPSYDDY